MIYIGSFLKSADNSGARLVKCLKIYKKFAKSKGSVGDIVLVSVRRVNPKKKIKKGEILKGIIVRSKDRICRYGGVLLSFNSSSIVLFNKRDGLLGTRILEPVAYELRNCNQLKLVSLAPSCI